MCSSLTRLAGLTLPWTSVSPTLSCRVAEELCREQEIAFIPVVAESLGGWHQVALDQFRKLGSALGRHTVQEEGEKLTTWSKGSPSILLQKGLSAMLLNRIPGHPAAEVDGLLSMYLNALPCY